MDIPAPLNTNINKKNSTQTSSQPTVYFQELLAKKASDLAPAQQVLAAEATLKKHKNDRKKITTEDVSALKKEEDEDIIDITLRKIEKKLSTLAEIERKQNGL